MTRGEITIHLYSNEEYAGLVETLHKRGPIVITMPDRTVHALVERCDTEVHYAGSRLVTTVRFAFIESEGVAQCL